MSTGSLSRPSITDTLEFPAYTREPTPPFMVVLESQLVGLSGCRMEPEGLDERNELLLEILSVVVNMWRNGQNVLEFGAVWEELIWRPVVVDRYDHDKANRILVRYWTLWKERLQQA